MQNARRAGFTAMLSLMKQRMTEALKETKNSSSGGGSHSNSSGRPSGAGGAAADDGGAPSAAGAGAMGGGSSGTNAEAAAAGAGSAAGADGSSSSASVAAAGAVAGSRAAAGMSAAAVDALAALKACVKHLETQKPPPAQQSYAYSMYNCSADKSTRGKQIASVLTWAVKAVKEGLPGAVTAVQRLVTLVTSAQEGLTAQELVPALVQAVNVLGLRAMAPALQQLVHGSMAAYPSNCIELIKAVQAQPLLQELLATVAASLTLTPDNLTALVVAVPKLPAIQDQLVGKLAAAMQSSGSAQLAADTAGVLGRLRNMPRLQQQLARAAAAALVAAGPVQHLSSCCKLMVACKEQPAILQDVAGGFATAVRSNRTAGMQAALALQLVQPLGSQPALYTTMQEAVAEGCLTSDACLTSQSDDSMLQLSAVLLRWPQLKDRYYSRFAAAAVQRSNSYSLLKQLLDSGAVKGALEVPGVQQLVAVQVARLERMAQVPAFSWHMPQACVSQYPQVSLGFVLI